jgi:hypothetical protein
MCPRWWFRSNSHFITGKKSSQVNYYTSCKFSVTSQVWRMQIWNSTVMHSVISRTSSCRYFQLDLTAFSSSINFRRNASLQTFGTASGTFERPTERFLQDTRWFKYDRDYLCVNKSQFVTVIFEPPCNTTQKHRRMAKPWAGFEPLRCICTKYLHWLNI